MYTWTSEHPLVMGIINATPDSFSGDGLVHNNEKIIEKAIAMEKDGADIIDVGGESTKRFSFYYDEQNGELSVEQELDRVIPIITQLRKNLSLPISIDTYKARVAEEALRAGALIVNDISAGQYDQEMFDVVSAYSASVILMHNDIPRSGLKRTASFKKQTFLGSSDYCKTEKTIDKNFVSSVYSFLMKRAKAAEARGIQSRAIALDPGFGFGKTTQQNLVLLKHFDELTRCTYPFVVGTSRKSLIGQTLGVPIDKRLAGSLATYAVALMRGAKIFRVHDVKETVEVIRMIKAIENSCQ